MSNKPTHVVVLGAGQIGQASYILTHDLSVNPFVELWDRVRNENVTRVIDLEDVDAVAAALLEAGATHVVNCLPFNLNAKVATAASIADCHYIDFTEDDVMADRVQAIYGNHPHLTCAVKCGLAPGFINYVGHDLVRRIAKPESLMISVGALPRHINGTSLMDTYNLSWSVDGLVNEYIRPCRVRMNGEEKEIQALSGLEPVTIDGVQYEAAFTSGGIGSLVKELKNVPNVAYKTLRYPGHYAYVKEAVDRNHGDFDRIKAEFLKVFPLNKNDVIVTYAEARGKDENGGLVRHTVAYRFIGGAGLSAIQATTAGAGIAILEMMLEGKLRGIVNHADVTLDDLLESETIQTAYNILS